MEPSTNADSRTKRLPPPRSTWRFFDDPRDERSDRVDGAIGEFSPFHEMYGYYAQGVSITTAKLPRGWQDRLVVLETDATRPGRGHCLDPHDCVISKLVAGREKDYVFAASLLRAQLVDVSILTERVRMLAPDVSASAVERIVSWLAAIADQWSPPLVRRRSDRRWVSTAPTSPAAPVTQCYIDNRQRDGLRG